MASDATAPIGEEVRAGSRVLSIFENPLNARILRAHSDGPQRFAQVHERLGSREQEAKAAIKALAGGRSSTLTRALAAGPFTLTEISAFIPGVSYPHSSAAHRLDADGRPDRTCGEGETGTPYVVTDWLRHAVAPICAAGRCEPSEGGETSSAASTTRHFGRSRPS